MPAQSLWTLLSWGPDGWLDDIAYGALVTVALALATLPIGLTNMIGAPSYNTPYGVLMAGTLLTVMGVVLNRVNVVVLAMNLRGTRPQFGPEPYHPALVEWGVSIGLIAATIFLFKLGARLWPVLPRETAESGHPSH